jgi:hypothetical protein
VGLHNSLRASLSYSRGEGKVRVGSRWEKTYITVFKGGLESESPAGTATIWGSYHPLTIGVPADETLKGKENLGYEAGRFFRGGRRGYPGSPGFTSSHGT